eukprot:COSAG04_NODE_29304_length_270_cov_0.573099_2_plen_27_part_01
MTCSELLLSPMAMARHHMCVRVLRKCR